MSRLIGTNPDKSSWMFSTSDVFIGDQLPTTIYNGLNHVDEHSLKHSNPNKMVPCQPIQITMNGQQLNRSLIQAQLTGYTNTIRVNQIFYHQASRPQNHIKSKPSQAIGRRPSAPKLYKVHYSKFKKNHCLHRIGLGATRNVMGLVIKKRP